MDKESHDYKILVFEAGKSKIHSLLGHTESQMRCEFYKLFQINNVFPIVVLDTDNNVVAWNNYFELEEVNKLINSTFKELI